MANKLSNLKSAFKDTKSRVLLLVIVAIIVIGITIGWLGLKRAEKAGAPSAVAVQRAPSNIQSIPGAGSPSREYVKTQERENIQRVEKAIREGTSAVPTITRTTYVGPSDLSPVAAVPTTPTKTECTPEALARAKAAGVTAEELRCKGCSAADLRAAGYVSGELLNASFDAADLRVAGYTADDLRGAGYTAVEEVRAGYGAGDLAAAGFNAAELKQAGVSPATAGLAQPPTARDCSPEALAKARAQGVSAAALRQSGCGAAALRAAGFSAQELKEAGFSAGELRQAGYSAAELRAAGFSAAELREAGFTAEELAKAGFTADELRAAGFSEGELARAGLATPRAPTLPPAVAPTQTLSTTPSVATTVPAISSAEDASLAALEKLQQRQAEQLSLQERQERINQIQQNMNQQAGELIGAWVPPPQQRYVAATVTAGSDTSSAGGNGARAGSNGAAAGQQQSAPVIKAGTILYGVLETGLNSDEPSPILATIVLDPTCNAYTAVTGCSGPATSCSAACLTGVRFKGARLVGQFQRVDDKVVLDFKQMSLSGYPSTISVDAVAVDPETARTALASDVDHHYLSRYGSLFLSSFVRDYAKAIQQSGSSTTFSLAGVTTTYPELSAQEKVAVGLGGVGQQVATSLGGLFTRPPTVTVNSGEGIGILFLNDVSLDSIMPPSTPTALTTAPTTATSGTTVPTRPAAPTTAATAPTLPSTAAPFTTPTTASANP